MKKTVLLFIFLLFTVPVFSQIENINIDDGVYAFLKKMKVKGIIESIHDDVPNMSYAEVTGYLEEIKRQEDKLTRTERKKLERYLENVSGITKGENVTNLLGGESFGQNIENIVSQKVKYLYAYADSFVTAYAEGIGSLQYGHRLKPNVNNAAIYDMGFRVQGTVAKNFGYMLYVVKGLATGNREFALEVDPRLAYNFKFVENIEFAPSYDYTDGYLKWSTNPVKGMEMLAQIGREKTRFAFGYGSNLVLSGDHANLDFFKFQFKYGPVRYTSYQASTVGRFQIIRDDNYTKYIAANKFQLHLPNLFDLSIGEAIVYSGRGVDLTYLNPLIFYKFAEMSLQDRDNGTLFFDFQSDFIPNLELQASFFLDENILMQLADLERFSNKTAYQLGAYWYTPVPDLVLIAEYTRIRPYVYTHANPKNTYTSWDSPLGHPIGPNADQILFKADYALNFITNIYASYSYTRKGWNIYDENGNLAYNAGGNLFEPHRPEFDSDHVKFLSGDLYNYNNFEVGVSWEAFRDLTFYLSLKHNSAKQVSTGNTTEVTWINFKFTIEY
ncbi:MAG: hypothetical protein LCH52_12460 [Bacteroidetes bacterium]|nr:hypothetical protein [Bacteroidota bacterium]